MTKTHRGEAARIAPYLRFHHQAMKGCIKDERGGLLTPTVLALEYGRKHKSKSNFKCKVLINSPYARKHLQICSHDAMSYNIYILRRSITVVQFNEIDHFISLGIFSNLTRSVPSSSPYNQVDSFFSSSGSK
jgi:hypothetical protein